jgi:hypothetical protein
MRDKFAQKNIQIFKEANILLAPIVEIFCELMIFVSRFLTNNETKLYRTLMENVNENAE